MFQRHLPRMRKIGINTTGLTPQRAIPMLTRIVKFCAEHDLLVSVRVSLDGIGDIHDQVRHVKRGFDKAVRDDRGDAGAVGGVPEFPVRHRRDDLRDQHEDAQNILDVGAREEARHRVQHAAVHRRDAEQQGTRGDDRPEARGRGIHAPVLPRPGPGGIGPQRPGVPVPALRRHDRQRLPATMPCPFRTQGLLLNPYGDALLLRELEADRQRAGRRRRGAVLQGREPGPPRATSRRRSARPA